MTYHQICFRQAPWRRGVQLLHRQDIQPPMQQGEDGSLKKKNRSSLKHNFSSLVKEKIWYVYICISYSTCPLKCLKHVKRRRLNFELQDVFCFINFLLRKNSIFLIFRHHFDFWTNLVDMFCLKITAFNYNLNIRLMNAPHW